MWIVLLDHSGSMGEPFGGSGPFPGRSVRTTAEVKLDAARAALCERMRGLAPTERVAVIAFTSTAQMIFDGLASRVDEVEALLGQLQAYDGTSVAAAFDAASALLDAECGDVHARVLLVSDCKSDLAAAVEAADRLAQRAFPIDVLLIDPDPSTESHACPLWADC